MSLNQDLEQIRIHHKFSREAVHNTSKIALSIIESIENGSIFEDVSGITYQRSYVRTYAKSIKITDNDIVQALDDHFSGRYNGLLAQKYITDSVNEEHEIQESAVAQHHSIGLNEDTSSDSKATPEAEQHKLKDEPKIQSPKPRKVISGVDTDITRIPQADASSYNKTKSAPNVSSVNWANVNSDKKTSGISKTPFIVVGVLVILIVVIYGIIQIVSSFGDSDTNEPKKELVDDKSVRKEKAVPAMNSADSSITSIQEQKADSISLVNAVEPVQSLESSFTLPDTLYVLVWAKNDKLEPVRVKTDITASYFPYWVEKGTAMRFEFKDELSIKGQFDRMMLVYNNGRPMEDFKTHRGIEREIVISRTLYEAKIDSVKPVNEIEFARFPKPTKIINRPVF